MLSIPLRATPPRHNLAKVLYIGSNLIINNYFLQPLVYRVQQHIGDEAWQRTLAAVSGIALEQAFQEIANELRL